MQRIALSWSLAIVLLPPLAAAQDGSASVSGVVTPTLPRIISSAEAAADRGPAPKVYHFDVSRSPRRARFGQTTNPMSTADAQVCPATALVGGTQSALVRLEDDSLTTKREPPKPPLDEPPPPVVGGAEAIPPPADYAPQSWNSGGWLGGIPMFTLDCPPCRANPWKDYCREHRQRPCGPVCLPACESGAAACDCRETAVPCPCPCTCSGRAAVGTRPALEPTPLPEIESSPSDRPFGPPKSNGTPTKRRPPRNEIPQETKSDDDSGG